MRSTSNDAEAMRVAGRFAGDCSQVLDASNNMQAAVSARLVVVAWHEADILCLQLNVEIYAAFCFSVRHRFGAASLLIWCSSTVSAASACRFANAQFVLLVTTHARRQAFIASVLFPMLRTLWLKLCSHFELASAPLRQFRCDGGREV